MFIHTQQPFITTLYIKSTYFCRISDVQRRSAIFCATGAWGGKPIGRVRVKITEIFTRSKKLILRFYKWWFFLGSNLLSWILTWSKMAVVTKDLLQGIDDLPMSKEVWHQRVTLSMTYWWPHETHNSLNLGKSSIRCWTLTFKWQKYV